MSNNEFENLCKHLVKDYYKTNYNQTVALKDIYVVWECKTLQNNKALLSTNVEDHRYFEITYNGDKHEVYVDAYKKEKNYSLSYLGEVVK